ncbi:AAA domain-containing protein, partial [Abortiporus biennis]
SNVAVKNIAEKLADCDFFKFKLLVSFDFHFDWHEHMYGKIEENIIRGDTFKLFSVAGLQVALDGCRVILCTISMLSHPLLVSAGFTQLVPLDTVIVDEASQIEIGDYFPMISMFGRNISKLVFIGDDKQCVPIGNFISTHVYSGKLRTQHTIQCPSSCRLIDVYHGEEAAQGTSWINHRERDAVLHLAKKYHKEGKSYRIITPYDPQRGLLEEALKQGGLPWEDRCFCVDSFQGNEDDHIIISVVRSDKIGFLKNLRRSNVMLSRCKASMTICTSRAYLNGVASSTLLGKLAKEWGAAGWVSWYDLVNGRF